MNYFNQETSRLILRKLIPSDIDHWIEFFQNNDSLHFLGIDLTKDKYTLAKEWIDVQLVRYEKEQLGHLALVLKSTGEFIGVGGIIPRSLNDTKEYEIAYSIIPRYWGAGYATEAAIKLKEYGFDNNLSNRFISIIHKDNIRSIKVAMKNNMKIIFDTSYMGMDVHVFGIEKEF